MANKVLIGVGIGCGAIVFIGIIAVVAGGIWVKGKVDEVGQDMGKNVEKMQSLEQRVTDLNKRYTFAEPPKGQPLALSEDRLQDYLKVRAALKPVLEDYQVKAKSFDTPKGEQPSIGKVLQASGLIMGLKADLNSKWMDELEHQKMSPREFHSITAAVYSAELGKAKGEAPKHEQNTPSPESQKIYEANAVLSEKYKQKIEETSGLGLDVLLVGVGSELGTAFQDAAGKDGANNIHADDKENAEQEE